MPRPSLNRAFIEEGVSVVSRAEHPLAYRVPEAARMVGVSKSKMWAMIAGRMVDARKIGGSTVVTHAALQALLDGAPPPNTK